MHLLLDQVLIVVVDNLLGVAFSLKFFFLEAAKDGVHCLFVHGNALF